MIDNSYKESTDVFELFRQSRTIFLKLPTEPSKKDLTLQFIGKEAIDKIKLKDKEGSGVPSGFRDVDKETEDGKTDLIIIAARPAMGKPCFILRWQETSVDHHIPMALFLKMASVQLITRMIASETGISSEKLRKGQNV